MEYSSALSLPSWLGKIAKRSGVASSWGTIGAICESSRWLAQRMKNAIDDNSLPVIELGAGYGSVTRVLPAATISIERDAKRFERLRTMFPDRTILESCAIPVLAQLTVPTVIVSSIPSVNNPEFARLRKSIAHAYEAGTVKTLITYSYFPHNPFAGIFAKSEMVALEVLNIPPAFVWKYSC